MGGYFSNNTLLRLPNCVLSPSLSVNDCATRYTYRGCPAQVVSVAATLVP